MAKILLSYIKDNQHALEIFRDFNFLGQNKLIFTEDIIIFYPIVPYPKLLYSILSYFIPLYDCIINLPHYLCLLSRVSLFFL